MSLPTPALVVQVASLQVYPPAKPADPALQEVLKSLWRFSRKFIILSGPPGVGKSQAAEDYIQELTQITQASHTKTACRVGSLFPDYRNRIYSRPEIESILRQNNIKFIWDFCVLHPQYTYEDLIRGFRMASSGNQMLVVQEGVLGFIARVVSVLEQLHPGATHPLGVLVLDEINRAPIGQLFGEALYAIDRRGEYVTTPYHLTGEGSEVAVPESLLLIGTMNSIDRATSGFDFALRRRITLVNVMPRRQVVEERLQKADLVVYKATLALYDLLTELVMTAQQEGIIPQAELVIGHSYFLPPSNVTEKNDLLHWLAKTYLYRILPTLVDYHEQGLLFFSSNNQIMHLQEVIEGRKLLGDLNEDDVIKWLELLGEEKQPEPLTAQ